VSGSSTPSIVAVAWGRLLGVEPVHHDCDQLVRGAAEPGAALRRSCADEQIQHVGNVDVQSHCPRVPRVLEQSVERLDEVLP
jgi:hypothetical protein